MSAHDLDHKLLFPTFPSEKLSVSCKHSCVARRKSCLSWRLHSKHCTPWSREINNRWASHINGQTPRPGKSYLHSHISLWVNKHTQLTWLLCLIERCLFFLSFGQATTHKGRSRCILQKTPAHNSRRAPMQAHCTGVVFCIKSSPLSIKRRLHSIWGLLFQRGF